MDLPHLTKALSTGDISLDKMRAVVGQATPETDQELAACAVDRTVPNSGEIAGSLRHSPEWSAPSGNVPTDQHAFNEACHTLSVQFPAEEFAEVRAAVEAQAKAPPSDGATRWDHRQYDAFLGLFRSGRRADSES